MNRKVSNLELFCVIIASVMGIGIITLPRRAAEGAGIDGILATMLAGVIFTAVIFIYASLISKYKTKTFLEFSEELIGKYLTRLIALLLSLHFFLTIAIQVRLIGQTIKQNLLFNTPLEVTMIAIIFVSAIAVSAGLLIISRISANYVVLTALALILVLGLSLRDFQIENLYSMFSNSFTNIIKTAFILTSNYIGFGVILFIVPMLKKPDSTIKVSVSAIVGVTILYTLTVITAFGQFSPVPNQYIVQPTVILSKGIFIGGFIERADILFIVFLILAAYIAITIKWFVASYALSKVFRQKNYVVFAFLSLPIVYLAALLPQNAAQVDKLAEVTSYTAWIGSILPVFILYIVYLIKKGGNKNAKAA